jgi:hypothetical protein
VPSTVVHVALAALLAAALLGTAYDRRALLVVVGVTAAADLDAFGVFLFDGAHRALLHNFLLPVVAGLVLYAETSLRPASWVRGRFGDEGVHVAWVSVLAFAVAAVGLDFVTNGVNALYPVVDQFYALNGKVELSTQKGLVQTFVELPSPSEGGGGGSIPAPESVGSTENVTYTTGVNPSTEAGVEDASVERVFPVVRSGWQLLVVVAGVVVTVARDRLPA